MKTFIKKITTLILFALPLYLIALIFIYQTNTVRLVPNIINRGANSSKLLTRLREVDSFSNIDILFLGSSHAYRGFDPRIFQRNNFTSFNLGSSSQSPINSEYLFKKYVNQLNPKHLIIEVYMAVFTIDDIESSLDLLNNGELDDHLIKKVISKPNLKTYNSLAYITINRLFEPLQKIKEIQDPADVYVSGGYTQRIIYDTSDQKIRLNLSKNNMTAKEEQIKALERIIELASQKNIKVTLVTAPVAREAFPYIIHYKAFHQTINAIAKSYDIEYIDYNMLDNIYFDTSLDFYDSDHLNQRGVEKFNSDLIARLF